MNPFWVLSHLWVWGVSTVSIPLFLHLVLGLSGYFWVLSRFPLKRQINSHLPSAQKPPRLPPHSGYQSPLPGLQSHTSWPPPLSGSISLLPLAHFVPAMPPPRWSSGTQDKSLPQGPRTCCSSVLRLSSHMSTLSPPQGLHSDVTFSDHYIQNDTSPLGESPQSFHRGEDQGSERLNNLSEVSQQPLCGSQFLSKSGPDFQLLCPTLALPW